MTILIEPPQPQVSWNNLQNIPSDFKDNQIDWNEIANKPFNNNFVGLNGGNRGVAIVDSDSIYENVAMQFSRGKAGFIQASYMYMDWAWNDDVDYDVRIGCDGTTFHILAAGNIKLALTGVPESPVGLPLGVVWKDSNGFLRIV